MMRRILVVDDDENMVRTLSDILRLADWEPAGARSGEEAIALVERMSFTAVLMDVRMGGMSGVDALRAIRARRPGLPVVLMTAYSAQSLLEQAEDAGAARILAKPVPVRPLIDLLGRFASGRRTLLLVDDDPLFTRTLSELLTREGYEVIACESLEAATGAVQAHTPSVVLLDLRLGATDPVRAVEVIRHAVPGAALLLVSGYRGLLDETTAALPAEWFAGRLAKPVVPEDLTALLHHVLD